MKNLLICAALAASPCFARIAIAQDAAALSWCSSLSDDAERLACYDRTAKEVPSARTSESSDWLPAPDTPVPQQEPATPAVGYCAAPCAADQTIRGVSSGVVMGPARVDEYATVSGVVNGDLAVSANASLICSGVIVGDVTVSVGGQAVISGVVKGALINNGGYVKVLGNVGFIRNMGSTGIVVALAGSYVSGRKMESDKTDF